MLTGRGDSERTSLISHSIDGSFAIRQGDWKLCLCRGSGGWSEPKEPAATKQGLPLLQLFHLGDDPAETANVAEEHPERVAELLLLLDELVQAGRSTPGAALANDRAVAFLQEGVSLPSRP